RKASSIDVSPVQHPLAFPTPPKPHIGRARIGYRTTLALAVRNEPGSLHRCLGVLAAAGLNMSKLESRPDRRHPWEYVFWVDLDGSSADPATAAALDELRGVAVMVRLLGSYARAMDRWEG
ncbi:MAG TPA: ACT domain-containing protein, partial [Candidatus Limnocylindrales bacterium]